MKENFNFDLIIVFCKDPLTSQNQRNVTFIGQLIFPIQQTIYYSKNILYSQMNCFKVHPSTGAIGKVPSIIHLNAKSPYYTIDNNQIEIDTPVKIQVNTTRFTVTVNSITSVSIDIKQYERFLRHRKTYGISCIKKPDRRTLDYVKELSANRSDKSMAGSASLNQEDDIIFIVDKDRKSIQFYNKEKQFIFHDDLKNGKQLEKEKSFFFSGHKLIPWTDSSFDDLKSLVIHSRKKQILNERDSQTGQDKKLILQQQRKGQKYNQMAQQEVNPLEKDKHHYKPIILNSRVQLERSESKGDKEKRQNNRIQQAQFLRERSREKPVFQRQKPSEDRQQTQRLRLRSIGRSNERILMNRSNIKNSKMQEQESENEARRRSSLQKSMLQKSQDRKNNERHLGKSQKKIAYEQEHIQQDIFEEQQSQEKIFKRRLFEDSSRVPRGKRNTNLYEKGKIAERTGLKDLSVQANESERDKQNTVSKTRRIRKQTRKMGSKKAQQRFPALSKIRARGAKLNQNIRVFKNVLDQICNRAYKSYINNAYTNQLCVLTPTGVIDVRQLGDSQYLFINQFKSENQTVTEPPIQLKYLNSAKQLINIRASKMIYNEQTCSLFFNDKYLKCLHRFSFLGKFFQYIPLEQVAIDITNGKGCILGIHEGQIFEYNLRTKNVFWGIDSSASFQKIVQTTNGFLVASNKGVISLFENHQKVKQFKVIQGVKQLKINHNNEYLICKYENDKTIVYQIRKQDQKQVETRANEIFRSHNLKLAEFSLKGSQKNEIIGIEQDDRYGKLSFIVKDIIKNENVHSQRLDIEKGEHASFVKYLDDLVVYGVDGIYQTKLIHFHDRRQSVRFS